MNRGTDSILSVYSDARAEYTKQLCVFLVPAFFQFFTELLEKAKISMINEPKRALWQFQNFLNEIHDWNIQKVNNEIHLIYTNCGCDYLEDLLTAVFIAHTKVLTAIRLSSNNKKVEINIPKVEHFLFKVLCETSKLLWSSTYLFRDGIPGIEKQQNYRMIEQLINEGILQAVRGLVPVKSILRDFVSNDNGDDDNSDDEKEQSRTEVEDEHESNTIKSSELSKTEHNDNILNETEQEPVNQNNIVSADINIPEPVVLNQTVEPVTQVVEPSQDVLGVPKEENASEQPKEEPNTIVTVPQTIIIDEKPSVRFGEFDAVFDSDHPMDSDMIYEPKDDEVPALEIMEGDGMPLVDGLDFDDLAENEDKLEEIGVDDYEEL